MVALLLARPADCVLIGGWPREIGHSLRERSQRESPAPTHRPRIVRTRSLSLISGSQGSSPGASTNKIKGLLAVLCRRRQLSGVADPTRTLATAPTASCASFKIGSR